MKCLDLIIADVDLKLTVVEKDGVRYVPVTPICEAIGVDAPTQRRRVLNDHRFEGMAIGAPSKQGTIQETVCVPIERLEAFLFTINIRMSMRTEVRRRLAEFQTGLAKLIHNAFNGEMSNNEMMRAMMVIINDLKEAFFKSEARAEKLAQKVNQLESELAQQKNIGQHLVSFSGSVLGSQPRRQRHSAPEVRL